MSNHTPGPWAVNRTHANGDDLLEVNSENRHITLHMIEAPEDEANARLIAAAPDLLEALEGALDTWADLSEDSDIEILSAVGFARSAIAKARGQS